MFALFNFLFISFYSHTHPKVIMKMTSSNSHMGDYYYFALKDNNTIEFSIHNTPVNINNESFIKSNKTKEVEITSNEVKNLLNKADELKNTDHEVGFIYQGAWNMILKYENRIFETSYNIIELIESDIKNIKKEAEKGYNEGEESTDVLIKLENKLVVLKMFQELIDEFINLIPMEYYGRHFPF